MSAAARRDVTTRLLDGAANKNTIKQYDRVVSGSVGGGCFFAGYTENVYVCVCVCVPAAKATNQLPYSDCY